MWHVFIKAGTHFPCVHCYVPWMKYLKTKPLKFSFYFVFSGRVVAKKEDLNAVEIHRIEVYRDMCSVKLKILSDKPMEVRS